MTNLCNDALKAQKSNLSRSHSRSYLPPHKSPIEPIQSRREHHSLKIPWQRHEHRSQPWGVAWLLCRCLQFFFNYMDCQRSSGIACPIGRRRGLSSLFSQALIRLRVCRSILRLIQSRLFNRSFPVEVVTSRSVLVSRRYSFILPIHDLTIEP